MQRLLDFLAYRSPEGKNKLKILVSSDFLQVERGSLEPW